MADPGLKPGVNIAAGERFLRGDDLEPVLRDSLALAMLAAWMGVPVDKLPPGMRAHTCRDTMERWKRVGEVAMSFAIDRLNATPDVEGEIG